MKALVESLRAQGHPYFAQLEAMMRKKLPQHANDDLAIAFAVCQWVELCNREAEIGLREANPGVRRRQ